MARVPPPLSRVPAPPVQPAEQPAPGASGAPAVPAALPVLRVVLVLSLGFDIFELDPQSKVAVTREGFGVLGERIRSLGLPCLIVQ